MPGPVAVVVFGIVLVVALAIVAGLVSHLEIVESADALRFVKRIGPLRLGVRLIAKAAIEDIGGFLRVGTHIAQHTRRSTAYVHHSTPNVNDQAPGAVHPLSPVDRVGEPGQDELVRLFGYSHDVLTIMDRRGRVVMISPSVGRILGLSPKEVMGERLILRVHPEDRYDVKAKVRDLMDGRPVGDLDVRVAGADGAWVPMRWSLAAGQEGRVYGVGRDHTDQALHRDAMVQNEMAQLRLRTAMELHDGILQTLTGAGLQIAVARKLIRTDPTAAENVLEVLGSSMAAEQQEMRLYVNELKDPAPVWTDGTGRFAERIHAALERVGAIWGIRTSVETDIPGWIGGEVGRQVVRIAQEAAVNAARHGDASAVSVVVERQGSDIAITISDDGRGFSFLGKYDHEALRENRLGPLSLKHRVEETGGRISIDSTREGGTVFVRVPLPREEESE